MWIEASKLAKTGRDYEIRRLRTRFCEMSDSAVGYHWVYRDCRSSVNPRQAARGDPKEGGEHALVEPEGLQLQ